MKTLASYLSELGMSQKAFALKVGADQSLISRIATGENRPSINLALKIERITEGAVPVEVWEKPEKAA